MPSMSGIERAVVYIGALKPALDALQAVVDDAKPILAGSPTAEMLVEVADELLDASALAPKIAADAGAVFENLPPSSPS